MLHLGKGIGDAARDPLGRRIRRRELRVLFFEFHQLAEQMIVFGILYLGLVKHVVAVIVAANLLDEFLVTRFGIRRNERWGRHHFASGSTAASPGDSGTAQS